MHRAGGKPWRVWSFSAGVDTLLRILRVVAIPFLGQPLTQIGQALGTACGVLALVDLLQDGWGVVSHIHQNGWSVDHACIMALLVVTLGLVSIAWLPPCWR